MLYAEKTGISLPRELYRFAEQIRHKLGLTRSKFYQLAIKTYLDQFNDKETEKLAHLYKKVEREDKKLLAHYKDHSYKQLPVYEA